MCFIRKEEGGGRYYKRTEAIFARFNKLQITCQLLPWEWNWKRW